MMQAVGVVLLAFGGAWLGFRAAGELSHRAGSLGDMAAALELLAQELEFGGWDLEECFRFLSRNGRGTAGRFFAACAEGMEHLDEEEFSSLWLRLCGESGLGAEGQRILSALGHTLGRCDAQRQRQALDSAAQSLEALAQQTGEQYRRQGKVFQALGVSSGAFLAILLL